MMHINMKLNMGCTQVFVNLGYLGRAWGWYARGERRVSRAKTGGGKGWEEGIVREFETNMYTLPYLKEIANKDLLYSTWNSVQGYVVAWMGGKVGADWIHACGWLSPFAMDLKLSQHCNQLYSDIKLKVKKKEEETKH